ncbi:hypothetical protein J8273_4428 [Carpediemonas membranifera]|uniref:Uncharacterized protein n=1 Tax=Carpediemonas membranifera TaxID=201153 RepID=A0A8J6AXP0_9EUKA|nr:hypothetical protein J8273_4428 [Carpediemonas membranifera]|eukprot:KAG9394065.1 hypothetical protein J8273_4428 [Carpediemonas membranifera]
MSFHRTTAAHDAHKASPHPHPHALRTNHCSVIRPGSICSTSLLCGPSSLTTMKLSTWPVLLTAASLCLCTVTFTVPEAYDIIPCGDAVPIEYSISDASSVPNDTLLTYKLVRLDEEETHHMRDVALVGDCTLLADADKYLCAALIPIRCVERHSSADTPPQDVGDINPGVYYVELSAVTADVDGVSYPFTVVSSGQFLSAAPFIVLILLLAAIFATLHNICVCSACAGVSFVLGFLKGRAKPHQVSGFVPMARAPVHRQYMEHRPDETFHYHT